MAELIKRYKLASQETKRLADEIQESGILHPYSDYEFAKDIIAVLESHGYGLRYLVDSNNVYDIYRALRNEYNAVHIDDILNRSKWSADQLKLIDVIDLRMLNCINSLRTMRRNVDIQRGVVGGDYIGPTGYPQAKFGLVQIEAFIGAKLPLDVVRCVDRLLNG